MLSLQIFLVFRAVLKRYQNVVRFWGCQILLFFHFVKIILLGSFVQPKMKKMSKVHISTQSLVAFSMHTSIPKPT